MSRSLKVVIRITDRCNLNCAYCYVDRKTRQKSTIRLSLESLSKLYSQILSGEYFDHVHVVWHGGEPTIVGSDYLDQAVTCQSQYLGNNVVVENSIQTNAILIDERLIRVFQKHRIGVGISLDAPPDIHNQLRVDWKERGTLGKVLEKIELMHRYGLHPGAICVLHRLNFERCDEIYDYFKSIGISFVLNPFYQDESTNFDQTERLSLSPDQYAKALIRIFDLCIDDQQPTIDVTDLKEIILSFFIGRSHNCLFSGKCHEFIGILPSGEIFLCDMFYKEDYKVGTIDTLRTDQLIHSEVIKRIKRRPNYLLRKECKGCQWWNICHGGCSSKACAFFHTPFHKDPFCESRQRLFEHIQT